MSENRKPGYVERLKQLAAQWLADGTIQPSELSQIGVYHDDWCQIFRGKPECNCFPEIRPPERIGRSTK